MSRFTRERSDGNWYRGLKVPHTVIRNIDEKTKKAVSSTGGTWAPSSAIVIGGDGLELQCSMQLSGTAAANPSLANVGVFRFGDDDYFKHAALVSRSVHDSPLLLGLHHALQREARPWISVGIAVYPALRTKRADARLRMPLRLPDGALLSAVEIGFRVGQAHANVPTNLPKARVVRITSAGVITQHPNPSSTLYEPDGWVSFPTPASGAAWYAAGAQQTLTLSYDYLNTEEVDTSTYGYALEWWEENGTNAFTDDVGTYLDYFKTTFYQADLRPY